MYERQHRAASWKERWCLVQNCCKDEVLQKKRLETDKENPHPFTPRDKLVPTYRCKQDFYKEIFIEETRRCSRCSRCSSR